MRNWKIILENIGQDDIRIYEDEELKFDSTEKRIANLISSAPFDKYKIQTRHGHAIIDNNLRIKIQGDIEKQINQIGAYNILKELFDTELKVNFDNDIGRYLFPHVYSQIGDALKIGIPYNYLINLCVKNINDLSFHEIQQSEKKKLFDFVSNFLFLLGYYECSKISNMFNYYNINEESLKKNIIYDDFYRIRQCSINNFSLIFRTLFKNIAIDEALASLGFTSSDVFNYIEKLYKIKPVSLIIIKNTELSVKEQLVVEFFSHQDPINQGYNHPRAFDKLNLQNKPFHYCPR